MVHLMSYGVKRRRYVVVAWSPPHTRLSLNHGIVNTRFGQRSRHAPAANQVAGLAVD
jgi:hypothetical protein